MDKTIFQKRRKELMQMMENGVAVIPSACEHPRNGDVHYRFRPDSDFYYLSGFPEPDAVAVLIPGRAQGEFILFCREKDAQRELWDGRRAGLEGAVAEYGADDAFPIDDIDDILPGLLEERDRVYCTMGRYPDFDGHLIRWLNEVRTKSRAGVHAPAGLVDIGHILHEMRLVKHNGEIRAMRRAAQVSAKAHRRAMRACRPGRYEYQLEAELEYEFRLGGSHYPAYPSIVAGGVNACILHYTENTDKLGDGDLVLIDAGAEIDFYAADITRTFPVNGKFSGPQRDLYDVVLAAQHAAIDACVVGNTWNDPHLAAVRVLSEGLIDLGLLDGNLDDVVENGDYRKFYMHRTGHWLGMDVHDVGDYKIADQWRPLESGMALTVEPGLYVAPVEDVDSRFHGIGIRIEDDVLITPKGPEILTAGAPKDVDEIEALMAS
ncbi:MAG: Xaa-Pro aminopeptidase [Proteobacteria bacterium]|nr:MAG: Xaa-Pro aminopeptidase [Pseudomonadota bacterium]